MSNRLALAQTLPADVLRLILKWVVHEKRSPLFGNSLQVRHLKELQYVSSTWRQQALEFLWRQLKFVVDDTNGQVRLNCQRWVKNKGLPNNATNLVREIHVRVTLRGIISGGAHKLLNEFIGDTKCFPLANKVVVRVTDYKDLHIQFGDSAVANALEFAKLLKSIAPAATSVDVTSNGGSSESSSLQEMNGRDAPMRDSNEEALMIFANALYTNTKHASLNVFALEIQNLSTIDYSPLLTFLKIDCEKSSNLCTNLVLKSASTLRYLNVRIRDASMLLNDGNRGIVVYPNLQYLLMLARNRSHYDAQDNLSAVVPFPALRGLVLYSVYPFYDDVLLRGNSATLEYLNFRLEHDTITMLHQRRVFESKQKVLRHVFVRGDANNRNLSLVAEATMSRFLSSLASAAKKLSLSDPELISACIIAAQHGQGFQSVRMFVADGVNMALAEVFRLLKALPVLTSFSGAISGLGSELERVSVEELPDYVASTYGNVGKKLQIWSINSFIGHDGALFTDCALLLALACPKLDRVKNIGNTAQNHRASVSKALESKPYS
ncbi:hypothetical protein IWW57_005226, partial [Coemansia sp. S610]